MSSADETKMDTEAAETPAVVATTDAAAAEAATPEPEPAAAEPVRQRGTTPACPRAAVAAHGVARVPACLTACHFRRPPALPARMPRLRNLPCRVREKCRCAL